jgi:hypothetical protein
MFGNISFTVYLPTLSASNGVMTEKELIEKDGE